MGDTEKGEDLQQEEEVGFEEDARTEDFKDTDTVAYDEQDDVPDEVAAFFSSKEKEDAAGKGEEGASPSDGVGNALEFEMEARYDGAPATGVSTEPSELTGIPSPRPSSGTFNAVVAILVLLAAGAFAVLVYQLIYR
jgi:hypothetical protein